MCVNVCVLIGLDQVYVTVCVYVHVCVLLIVCVYLFFVLVCKESDQLFSHLLILVLSLSLSLSLSFSLSLSLSLCVRMYGCVLSLIALSFSALPLSRSLDSMIIVVFVVV